jgi:hypothetical protein
VSAYSVVALRYQVESRASDAKFGNRFASIFSFPSIRLTVLSSSNTSRTTLVRDSKSAACTTGVDWKIRSDACDAKRNSATNTRGTGARTLRTDRIAPARE